MQKKFVLAVVLVLAALFLFGCTAPNNPNPQPSPNPNPNPSPGTAQTFSVAIQNFSFQPADLTINAGDTVVWTNMDSAPHKPTSDTGTEIASGSLSNGATYSHTFTQPGTYAYHCAIHPSMTATIIVQ